METLFERFILEKPYLNNLAETTLEFYRWCFKAHQKRATHPGFAFPIRPKRLRYPAKAGWSNRGYHQLLLPGYEFVSNLAP